MQPQDDLTRPAHADHDDDPWAMYYVVRSDRPLSLGQAMALGGAGSVACADRFRRSDRWAANFAAWQAAAHPKVALRANARLFPGVQALEGSPIATAADPTALCLPPRRKSERERQLIELSPFTAARRPAEVPEPLPGAMIYVIRPGVLKSMGKAIAQAGHAALDLADQMSAKYAAELARWRADGMPGDLRLADERTWDRLKAEVDCIVIRDAGYTQVAPGTETVLAIPPGVAQPRLVNDLTRHP